MKESVCSSPSACTPCNPPALLPGPFPHFNPFGDQRNVQQHDQERDGRSQYQWHGQEQDGRGHVHRMPDDSIKPRVDDLLILLHFDGSGQVGVLPQNLSVEQIADQEKTSRVRA